MIRRHGLCELYFRVCCFLLPGLAILGTGGALRRLALIEPLTMNHIYLCLILSLVWVVASENFKVSRVEALFRDPDWMRHCFAALACTYMSGFSLLFFYRGESFSRMLLGSSAVVLFTGVLVLGAGFKGLVRHAATRRGGVRVIVVGTDTFALEFSRRLQGDEYAPCETVAFVRVPGQRVEFETEIPIYEVEQLSGLNLAGFANNMVIAASPQMFPNMSGLIADLEKLALPIQLSMNLGAERRVNDRVFKIGGLQLLDLHIAPAETMHYVVLKRCFDVAFSLLALAFAGIPMLLIALAVKLSSPGPVLFCQERVGINGSVFNILKFRTMRVAPQGESDTRWTTTNDSRKTFIGSFLRKTSLDELPQFFNVLRGDMSVVGPRPERPHFVEKFAEEIDAYNSRHHLKSGITGWAQVNGWRGDTDIRKRVECDLFYVRNWSLGFDLRIVVMTVLAVFFARNAY
jgi:Undecaprenyl-phosphate glucose phosphotransferase